MNPFSRFFRNDNSFAGDRKLGFIFLGLYLFNLTFFVLAMISLVGSFNWITFGVGIANAITAFVIWRGTKRRTTT